MLITALIILCVRPKKFPPYLGLRARFRVGVVAIAAIVIAIMLAFFIRETGSAVRPHSDKAGPDGCAVRG
jgi:hypothetical protein